MSLDGAASMSDKYQDLINKLSNNEPVSPPENFTGNVMQRVGEIYQNESQKRVGIKPGFNRFIHTKRISLDRRIELDDRRKIYSIDYFSINDVERRKGSHERRRKLLERRNGWIRVSQWSSVHVG